MTYQEVLEWIHSKLAFGIKPGLERMAWMLAELGDPQEKIKAVHVVGTNGKGSTVNNLQKVLTASGYEVGTFTSPYIMDFKERFSLDGQMISEEDLVAIAEIAKPVVERLPLETDLEAATEFEVITLLMFLYFGSYHPVDIAIIEAGMGGRYDSTNLFHALAVVCPSIGLDHQAVLGNSYADIAREKAGVLTSGEPFIFATERSDVQVVFEEQAQAHENPIFQYCKDFAMEEVEGQLCYVSKDKKIDRLELAMPGSHQETNAALAIKTLELLQKDYPKISDQSIKQGLSQAAWLGRTELMADNLMIDGAHNNESIAVLVDLMKTKYADKNLHILFSAIDTKPIDSMLEQLADLGQLTVTSFDYPNAVALDKYPSQYDKITDFRDWLASRNQDNTEDFYLVTGSLYFISQVRHYLLES
ncbi:bifunctional folylpolyglutamate synthase/dihydrofolate synthase [Streptococcus loxodontisalivarius]|uniref:Dihydrofolate synthase/folylpolyglutamate synthase n=1 Tax=Streptococcus loxodontisalivarius TaxID=1349415 RepID=A0ABS2PSF7_9STRE|nr:folylpolyglutamate synthase/dihydrofolate synthase family protein [Streptococcus loxodontisalivarius]MBM7642935.1 dihydrofolate synthase/folylpolyglutamate synthase [Streptococcus loxodontisalivarius]